MTLFSLPSRLFGDFKFVLNVKGTFRFLKGAIMHYNPESPFISNLTCYSKLVIIQKKMIYRSGAFDWIRISTEVNNIFSKSKISKCNATF